VPSSRHQALERLQGKLDAAKEQLVVRTRRVLELEAIERQVNAIKMATKGDAVGDFLRSCLLGLFFRWRNELDPPVDLFASKTSPDGSLAQLNKLLVVFLDVTLFGQVPNRTQIAAVVARKLDPSTRQIHIARSDWAASFGQ
jgi:hypothetical protein